MGYIDPMRGFTVSLIKHGFYINKDGEQVFIPELDETIVTHTHVYAGTIGPLIQHIILDPQYNAETMSFTVAEEKRHGVH